jgi:hypothetical protein
MGFNSAFKGLSFTSGYCYKADDAFTLLVYYKEGTGKFDQCKNP